MAADKIHIIITGESGPGRNLLLSRRKIRTMLTGALTGLLLLAGTGMLGLHAVRRTATLQKRVSTLAAQLQEKKEEIKQQFGDAEHQLQAELARVRRQLGEARQAKARFADEKKVLIDHYEQEIAALKARQEELLASSISRLDERRKVIEAIMDSIGVDLKVKEDPQHSGGPYIQADPGDYGRQLITSTDQYLELLRTLPLGRPVTTSISSRYGRRRDPINHRRAFHAGIDFRGRIGDPVRATGGGTVTKVGWNGGLGRCVIIDHGNGFQSVFGHLSKCKVHKGDRIKRGQVVGLVGRSGRSTGSHLHYEIRYHGRSVNPLKYLKVAGRRLEVHH